MPSPKKRKLQKPESAPSPDGADSAARILARSAKAVDALYSSDEPWLPHSKDRLGRRGFAARIAQTIASNPDPAGLVLGLYGAWGEGKTSVLRMVEHDLREDSRALVLWFNPWYFTGEEQLIHFFFAALAGVIEIKLGTTADKLKSVLSKYGGLVSAAPLELLGLPINPGKLAEKAGDAIKSSSLSDLKEQIEDGLADLARRVVVIIDDIDRLDSAEVHAVFKLVKLTGGFRYVTYVCAFDDTAIATSLAERYGGDGAAGRQFLEKIIQVPLRLPAADANTELSLVLEYVDQALASSQTTISREAAGTFRRYFDPLFQSRTRTPRASKRYANALAFWLPTLRAEVHVGDLLLLEAIRAFYPLLYDQVRPNRELFVGNGRAKPREQDRREDNKRRLREMLTRYTSEESRTLEELLKHLFPLLEASTGNFSFGDEFEERLAKEMRVGSNEYFDRFFQYSVPPGDVSDREFDRFISALGASDASEAQESFLKLATPQALESLILKLRRQERSVGSQESERLVRLLVDNANLYPRTDQFYDFTGPFAQAAVLIKKLLGNLAEERREILTRDVLSQPTLLVFAIECWDWMRTRKEDEPKAPPFLRVEFEKEVGDLLAARLRASWLERPFYQYPRMEAQKLLFSWLRLCGRGETNVALGLRFILQTSDAITLLRVLSSVPVSMSTGLELPATFGRENYNNLKQLVDPEVIFNAIELLPARTGKPAAEEEFTERADSEDRVTDRFLHVYAIASAHSATESQPDSVTELD